MRSVALLFILLFSLLLVEAAKAQDVLRIAAIVNDEVISLQDLGERLSLAMASAGLEDRPEIRRRLAPQVLRGLIDEKLKSQEAKRLDIRVASSDMEKALRLIEKQNKVRKGGLKDFLARKGIKLTVLAERIEKDLAWSRVVDHAIRPRIHIGQEEIDDMLAQVKAGKGKPEYQVAEIFLPVDNPGNENDVRVLAERLIQQLRSGATFSGLAQNFSQSAAAGGGGELGWVRQGQLMEELDKVLVNLRTGQTSAPIRSIAGYHILRLLDRRVGSGLTEQTKQDPSVSLQQLFLPLTSTANETEVASQTALATTMGQLAADCSDMKRLGAELGTTMSGGLGKVKTSQLPLEIRAVVERLPVQKSSQPIRVENGVMVLMVCDREPTREPQEKTSEPAERERVKGKLLKDRIDVAVRQYLRDLRRAAFVEIRI